VIAQLPQKLRDKVTLVTVGCPLRKLYGRAFPAYFGQHCLLDLASKLTQDQPSSADIEDSKEKVPPGTRWWNLIRPSDYVGSYVFEDTMELKPGHTKERYNNGDCQIDKRLLDPPRIVPVHGTTPPPIHEHSDYWPDPQTAVHTQIAVLETRIFCYVRLGNYCKALEYAQELLLHYERMLGTDDSATLATRDRIAVLTAKCVAGTQGAAAAPPAVIATRRPDAAEVLRSEPQQPATQPAPEPPGMHESSG
jgi:hypothetical protein